MSNAKSYATLTVREQCYYGQQKSGMKGTREAAGCSTSEKKVHVVGRELGSCLWLVVLGNLADNLADDLADSSFVGNQSIALLLPASQ